MSNYIQGLNVNQMSFMPFSLDEIIDGDNPVRGINAVVDALDKDSLKFNHSETKRTGRPPYDPIVMFKIYLYCYYNKVRSSRSIEKECKRNLELIWLAGGLAPDHKTIAEFRKNNKRAIEEAHKAFVSLCCDLDLVGKEIVALDGTKIRANNSRKNNVTISKLNKMIEHHEENIREYFNQLAQNDIAEDTATIKSKLKHAQEKKLECENMIAGMEEEGIKEKSLTDPDSHQMGVANKGTDIAYNVQNVVDEKEHIIVTTDVVTTPADQTQLYAMAKKTAEELNISINEALILLADKGYWRIEDLVKCSEDERIDAIVAVPSEKGNAGFKKSDFNYDKEKDVYICPMGQTMTRWKGKTATYTNARACKECPCKDQCTKSKKGKSIVRNEVEDMLDDFKQKYAKKQDLYRLRQQIVEHTFGTIKRGLGFTYFLTRGLENVKTENFLHVLTYNLKRVLNIFTVPELVMQVKEMMAKQTGKKTVCFVLNFKLIGVWKGLDRCFNTV